MNNIPKKGFAGLKAHFKEDFISGFSVSLIALPLCLGIAMASGVPPLAGIITAIVGGILASRVSGTFMTISGPAAGLIVITLGAAESMGGVFAEHGFAGYPHALGAIIVGGLIMAGFGLLKVGKVGDYFPSAAVHGMLAAIGVIIMVKLLFPALGVAKPKGEILEVMTEIPHAFIVLHYNALIITLVSIGTLIVHPMIKIKFIKLVPAPMWVLIFTIPLASYINSHHLFYDADATDFALKMVNLDGGLLNGGGLQLPSFEKIGTSVFWVAVVGVALVSAIESLLSAKAVDTLDPYKRKSNLDKDLISMGAGSSLAAALGGLPMISEIVRSSANVNNGAKTQWANFFHGVFLLIYVIIGVSIIEMIPNAALASMLVYTGFKLAHPREFKHMAKIGKTEIIVFIVTLVAVLATDLIIGILIGILVTYIFVLVKGNPLNNLFKAKGEREGDLLNLEGYLTFSNYLSFKKKMDTIINETGKLTMDFSNVVFIDHTVIHHIEDYERNAKLAGKDIELVNMDGLYPETEHELAARMRNKNNSIATANLPARTIDLLSYAHSKNYQFSNKVVDVETWRFYNLSIRRKITAIENILSIHQDNIEIQVADMHTLEGAQTTSDSEKITVAKISGLNNVPRFFMHKTDFLDRIKESLGNEDIDFEKFPEFSDKYVLRSDEDEKIVRKFFKDELLEFFTASNNVSFAGNGKDLVFYLKVNLLKTEELKELIEMSQKIVKILNK